MGDLFIDEPLDAGSAVFSPDRRHRFELWRRWDRGRFCLFIGLNPSTADEHNDDPTIRRCIGYAQSWGYSALCMVNIFSVRATDPARMFVHPEPVLPENDDTLLRLSNEAAIVIAAWGADGNHNFRAGEVNNLLSDAGVPVYCLGTTKYGQPRHPLYLRKGLLPIPFNKLADTLSENRCA